MAGATPLMLAVRRGNRAMDPRRPHGSQREEDQAVELSLCGRLQRPDPHRGRAHEGLAMGAIATGGGRRMNDDVIALAGVSARDIESVTAREREELARRERAYRGDRPPPDVRGRTAIVVDDGLATGATMRAA